MCCLIHHSGAVGRPFPGVHVRIATFDPDSSTYHTIVTATHDDVVQEPGMIIWLNIVLGHGQELSVLSFK